MIEIEKIIRDYYKQWYVNKMDNLEEMNKHLEKYNFWRLNQKGTENMNRPHTSTEIETVIKKTSNKQTSRTRWPHRQVLSNILRRANTYPSQAFPKAAERGTLSSSLYETKNTLI